MSDDSILGLGLARAADKRLSQLEAEAREVLKQCGVDVPKFAYYTELIPMLCDQLRKLQRINRVTGGGGTFVGGIPAGSKLKWDPRTGVLEVQLPGSINLCSMSASFSGDTDQ